MRIGEWNMEEVRSGMDDWGVVYGGSEEWYGGVFTWKTLPIKGCPTH